jgi:hypothetical protein
VGRTYIEGRTDAESGLHRKPGGLGEDRIVKDVRGDLDGKGVGMVTYRHRDIQQDLFTRVVEVAILVEVHPGIQDKPSVRCVGNDRHLSRSAGD